MKTILITGGAGFIGSHFINYISSNSNKYKIINFDKLTYASNVEMVSKSMGTDSEDSQTLSKQGLYPLAYTFIKGDISNKEDVEKVFRDNDIDIVINFAAESHVDKSIDDATNFIKTNVIGVQVLLDACKNHWGNYEKHLFFQISTDEVYGSTPKGEIFDEEAPYNPGNPYAASKASAEMLVKAYNNTYGMPYIITRSSNNFGANQNVEKLIPKTIHACKNNEDITIYGNGENKRTWLYVEDHCQALLKIVDSNIKNEIYNISSKNQLTNNQAAKEILESFPKSKSKIIYIKDRLGHDTQYKITSQKIQKELNWQPKTTFQEGITKIINNK